MMSNKCLQLACCYFPSTNLSISQWSPWNGTHMHIWSPVLGDWLPNNNLFNSRKKNKFWHNKWPLLITRWLDIFCFSSVSCKITGRFLHRKIWRGCQRIYLHRVWRTLQPLVFVATVTTYCRRLMLSEDHGSDRPPGLHTPYSHLHNPVMFTCSPACTDTVLLADLSVCREIT